MRAKLLLRSCLTSLGSLCSERTVTLLDNSLNYLEAGRWAASRSIGRTPTFPSRSELFQLVASEVGATRVLYLEFGVYRGDSMREWAELLSHPESHLHGFDSFEGLPEDWMPSTGKGHFTTHGRLPKIDDPRVRFSKGLFGDTLPHYSAPPHDVLVVNLDADLYSSTIFVLRSLRELMLPGTYLYFDEFVGRNHELRAFREFEAETGLRFDARGMSRSWEHALFQRPA